MKSVRTPCARFVVERVGDYIYRGEKATCKQTHNPSTENRESEWNICSIVRIRVCLPLKCAPLKGRRMCSQSHTRILQNWFRVTDLRWAVTHLFLLNEPTHCVWHTMCSREARIRAIQNSLTIHLYLAILYTRRCHSLGLMRCVEYGLGHRCIYKYSCFACYDFPRHTCRDPPSVASFMCNQFCWLVAGALMRVDRTNEHQND